MNKIGGLEVTAKGIKTVTFNLDLGSRTESYSGEIAVTVEEVMIRAANLCRLLRLPYADPVKEFQRAAEEDQQNAYQRDAWEELKPKFWKILAEGHE